MNSLTRQLKQTPSPWEDSNSLPSRTYRSSPSCGTPLPRCKKGTNHKSSYSQATLWALDSPVITSKLVLDTAYALDLLALTSNSTVTLVWVKAHAGHAGNELADSLAKQGAAIPIDDLDQVIPLPKSYYTKLINDEVARRWNHRWTKQTSIARQSRLLWPCIDRSRSLQILLCDRQEYGNLIRLFTGHNNLNRHRHLLNETDTAECRLCLEEEESSEHLLLQCPAIGGSRHHLLGSISTDGSSLSAMPFDGVRRFISLICRALSSEGLEKI